MRIWNHFYYKSSGKTKVRRVLLKQPFLFYNSWLTFLTTDYPMLITLTQTWSQFGLDRGTVEELHKIWWKINVAPFLENIFFPLFWSEIHDKPSESTTRPQLQHLPCPKQSVTQHSSASISGTPLLRGSNRVRLLAQACRNTPRMWNSRDCGAALEAEIQQETCEKC